MLRRMRKSKRTRRKRRGAKRTNFLEGSAPTRGGKIAGLALCGHWVSYGQATGPLEAIARKRLTAKLATLSHPVLIEIAGHVFTALREGVLRVHVRHVYPLAAAADGHRDLEARRTAGHSSSCPSAGPHYGDRVEGPARGARTSSAFTTRRTPRTAVATLAARALCSAETTSPVRYTTDCRLTTPSGVRLASFSATRRAFTSLSIRASCQGSTVAQPLTATTRPTRTSDQMRRAISVQHGTAVRSRLAQESTKDSGAARRARILRLHQVHLDPALRAFPPSRGAARSASSFFDGPLSAAFFSGAEPSTGGRVFSSSAARSCEDSAGIRDSRTPGTCSRKGASLGTCSS